MFEQSFVDERGPARKPWALAASLAFQLTGLAIVLTASLFLTEALPRARLSSFVVAPLPPVAAPPASIPASTVRIARAINPFIAPAVIPKIVTAIDDSDLPLASATKGVQDVVGALPGVILGTALSGIPQSTPPAPAAKPKVAAAEAQAPVPIGGDVQAANLIRKIVPAYPPLARQARVAGTVRFTAIIGPDGKIQNLQLIAGHPLLVASAREAVSQWIYRPTLLNGKPVEVITQIAVNFTLNQ
jgi:protein TonB